MNPELKVATLSAAGDALCIVSDGRPAQLRCQDQESLRELWRTDLPYELGGNWQLEQDAQNVYVLAQGRALAFDVASGRRLWATNEFRSFPPFKLLRGLILTSDLATPFLEWRNPVSGEVIAPWGSENRTYAQNAVLLGDAILLQVRHFDKGGGLRLVKLPLSVTGSSEAR